MNSNMHKYLLLSLMAVFFLFLMSACDLFDDDDDNNDDPGSIHDHNIVGTRYRYSLSLNAVSNDYIPSKLVLEEGGTGSEYTFLVTNNGMRDEVEAIEYDINWQTIDDEIFINNSENQDTLFQGNYAQGSGTDFLLFFRMNTSIDRFVRQTDIIDENVAAFWMLDSTKVEGLNYHIYYPGSVLMIDSNGTLTMGHMEDYRWGVNGSYIVMENLTNPNYDYLVGQYSFSENLDSLYLTHYGYDDFTYHWNPLKWEAVFYRFSMDMNLK